MPEDATCGGCALGVCGTGGATRLGCGAGGSTSSEGSVVNTSRPTVNHRVEYAISYQMQAIWGANAREKVTSLI